MLLRSAGPADAAEVAGVHVRSWQSAYRGLLPDEFLDGLRPEDRAARYTFGGPDAGAPATIVAVDSGDIRGFATAGPCREADARGTGELYAVYVDPCAWGRGVGRQLMAGARDYLARLGFGQAVLWVLAGNQRAERFYRLDGWAPDGCSRIEEIGPGWQSDGMPKWDRKVSEIRYHRALP
jgi:GNAT superfamily N-acetyltransferase